MLFRSTCKLNNSGVYSPVSVLRYESIHQLPIVISPDKENAPLKRMNLQKVQGSRNCIVSMDRLALLGARTISRWAYISASSFKMDDTLKSALNKFMINFCVFLVNRGYKCEETGLYKKTISLLREWCTANNVKQIGRAHV